MVRDRPRAWRECIRLPQRVERIAVTPAQEREIEQLAQRAARARETGIGHLFVDDVVDDAMRQRRDAGGPTPKVRSEEHTSELQSLMRISYAVFCLTKKNTKQPIHTSTKKTHY